jgi:hypothetical protein
VNEMLAPRWQTVGPQNFASSWGSQRPIGKSLHHSEGAVL